MKFPQEDLYMDANLDTPTMTKYGLEPFEAVIELMVTRYMKIDWGWSK